MDILLAGISDLHSGSNHALFPPRFWKGKNGNNHTPTSEQEKIHDKWVEYGKILGRERKDKKLVIVHVGDAIEGAHHDTVEVCSRDLNEQAEIFIELLDELKRLARWQRGDELYMVTGTYTHTADIEYDIAEQVNAQQLPDGKRVAHKLELTLNKHPFWFAHHGKTAGVGAREGDMLRGWLRDIYYESVKHRYQAPAAVYSAHVHRPTYNTYIYNDAMTFRTMQGIILPSWQNKTRYAHGVAPVDVNIIGGSYQAIEIEPMTPKFCVMT